jgi:hypothetical protein
MFEYHAIVRRDLLKEVPIVFRERSGNLAVGVVFLSVDWHPVRYIKLAKRKARTGIFIEMVWFRENKYSKVA